MPMTYETLEALLRRFEAAVITDHTNQTYVNRETDRVRAEILRTHSPGSRP